MPNDEQEKRMIELLMGPYAGQHLEVSAVDAETAISEGWARDPYKPHEPPREMNEDQRAAAQQAADKAARRWRGEEEPEQTGGDAEADDAEGDDDAESKKKRSSRRGE